MPLNSDCLLTNSRQDFCLALKTARERQGITLDEIAEATKIPASLFAGLERNDPRRWPKGLFRRSFFRGYARMIGVPVTEACAEFVRWFPDDEGAEPTTAAGAVTEAHEVRLALDVAWHGPRVAVLSRLLAALIDAGAVILVAAVLAWVAGMDPPATIAIVALAYFSLATALVGESPAKWAMSRRRSLREALRHGSAAIAAAWSRVGAAPSPRFRVRIKLPQ